MSAQLDEEFRAFMHARWPVMVRLAYALAGDLGHAEDVAQTAFARAHAAWPKVRRTGDPEAYVRRIVINENCNRFRKHRVADVLPDALAGSLVSPDAADATRPWTAPSARSKARPHAPWPDCGKARSW